MTGPVPAWISDPNVVQSIESGDTETFEAYSARLTENELVDLRAKYVLLEGERDGLRARVHQLLTERGPVTDTTDCTCGEGAER
ncbi:hypothetical protein [Streptomyces sp. NPDC056105]|uniref:hypothetical protein n=1 Tax=Streptomyces sp. NPDC056105 TaxID=3345714 RepID=UPI0035D97183